MKRVRAVLSFVWASAPAWLALAVAVLYAVTGRFEVAVPWAIASLWGLLDAMRDKRDELRHVMIGLLGQRIDAFSATLGAMSKRLDIQSERIDGILQPEAERAVERALRRETP